MIILALCLPKAAVANNSTDSWFHRNWLLHKHGRLHCEQLGASAFCNQNADLVNGGVLGFALCQDVHHVQHRGHLSTIEHRILADFQLICRGEVLDEMIFCKVNDFVQSSIGVTTDAHVIAACAQYQRLGDWVKLHSRHVLEKLLEDSTCYRGSPCTVGDVVEQWTSTGASLFMRGKTVVPHQTGTQRVGSFIIGAPGRG